MPSSRRQGWGPVPDPSCLLTCWKLPLVCLSLTAAGGEESQVPLGLAKASFFLRPSGLGTQSAKIKASGWLDPYLGPRRGCHPRLPALVDGPATPPTHSSPQACL